jgi:hypothetical protein
MDNLPVITPMPRNICQVKLIRATDYKTFEAAINEAIIELLDRWEDYRPYIKGINTSEDETGFTAVILYDRYETKPVEQEAEEVMIPDY